MKRIAAIILLVSVMISCVCTASAAGAGSQSDPLITESYFLDNFLTPLMERGSKAALEALNSRYGVYEEYAEELHDIFMLRNGGSGFRFTGGQEQITLNSGDSVSLGSGSTITLISGSVKMSVSSGEVIDLSSGTSLSGGTLSGLRQYFTVEKTVAVFTASSRSTVMVDGFVKTGIASTSLPFKDVPSGEWYYGAVSFVYDRGLFSGTSSSTFSPGVSMTRGMFVQVLWNLAGNPAPRGKSGFTDVADPSQWYYKAVCWASENDIVSGVGNGRFLPDNSITRQEMAVIMYNYVSFRGISTLIYDPTIFYTFTDYGDVSPWAKNYVVWATDRGIINGSGRKLMPLSTASRAEVAQIIKNCCEKISGI